MIQGIILDEERQPVESVSVFVSENLGTESNKNGFFRLEIPANREVTLFFTHLTYADLVQRFILSPESILEFNPVLKKTTEQIGEVVITSSDLQNLKGVTVIDPQTIRRLPGANAGIENLLKTLPGVSSNNELSTQYSVRGGNYDENLVYVNGMEIYRPFLVRSGQQEGLSFINPDLVQNIQFSAGGFQAKYGDKLSSVLDITYRRPVDFAASLEASLLGGSLSVEGVSKNRKFRALTGLRYRDNSLLVKARQTETNYFPKFADVQTLLSYQLSQKAEISFLGNISENVYNYQPLTRQTNFGTFQDPRALVVYYNGQEEDIYRTYFGGFMLNYQPHESYTTHNSVSVYNTREQEYFDIVAQYRMGRLNAEVGGENFGKVEYSEGIGAQLTHARNKLDALILNVAHKGVIRLQKSSFEYGLKFTREDIQDRVREYEIVDSAGFSVRPPLPDFVNNQPYEPYTAPIRPFTEVRVSHKTSINRYQAYLQWSNRFRIGEHESWINLGVRSHSWKVNTPNSSPLQTVVSPRGQFAIKPAWKKDMVFRISGGLYFQPPFYRELRDLSGELNPSVEAHRSIHLVLSHEYSFRFFERPFKLNSELYYKDLDNVNAYTLENVRIRYLANNDTKAYAYGLDIRLNGEFVPGTESWLSFGYLKTEENIENRGYIPRPTDQRLKFGMLFQDYVPRLPDLKMYLNLVYNTGLPGGSPAYADPYLYQRRLPDYKRADLGLFYLLKSPESSNEDHWLKSFEEVSVGLEILNIFDTQNAITNTFVRDVYSKTQYAVPNYLTPRVYNLKIGIKL
ncbi:carboxypeptidase-like regulatory domain-containing protein [Actinomadura fibrosa]